MTKRKGQPRELTARADRQYSLLLGSDLSRVRAEIADGWDPNIRDRDGRNLLINAATCGHSVLVAYLLNGPKCDPNAADSQGFSALHLAAMHGHASVVEMLLDAGASVDARDQCGNTPLCHAVHTHERGRAETVRALLDGGADPDDANDHGVTPRTLVLEVDDPEIVALLAKARE